MTLQCTEITFFWPFLPPSYEDNLIVFKNRFTVYIFQTCLSNQELSLPLKQDLA